MINYTLFHIHSLIFSHLQAISGEDRRHSFTIRQFIWFCSRMMSRIIQTEVNVICPSEANFFIRCPYIRTYKTIDSMKFILWAILFIFAIHFHGNDNNTLNFVHFRERSKPFTRTQGPLLTDIKHSTPVYIAFGAWKGNAQTQKCCL